MASPRNPFSSPFAQQSSPPSESRNWKGPILQPRLKPGQPITSHAKPTEFQTKRGKLLVPRKEDPPLPTPDMIREARLGNLISFFRSGTIVRASGFIGDVAPKSAKMSLEDKYEYQTRHLSMLDDTVADEAKSLRHLFYISLNPDELPSFHFWTTAKDIDPIEAARGVNAKEVVQTIFSSPKSSTTIKGPKAENQTTAVSTFGSHFDIDHSSPFNGPTPFGNTSPFIQSSSFDQSLSLDQFSSLDLSSSFDQSSSPAHTSSFGQTTSCRQPSFSVPNAEKSLGQSPKLSSPCIQEELKNNTGNDGRIVFGMEPPKELPKKLPQPPDKKACTTQEHSRSCKTSDTPSMVQENEVLLQFRKGGKYLADFTHLKFVEITRWLVEQEEDCPAKDKDMRIFVDIRDSATGSMAEHHVSSNRKQRQNYSTDVLPYLGKAGFDIRVRSSKMKETPFEGYGIDSNTLKVVRRGVGYFYVHVDWEESDLIDNSDAFMQALQFLYPEDSETDKPELLILEVPGHASFSIDRSQVMVINENTQAVFASITTSNQTTRAFEIFVYRGTEAHEQLALVQKRGSQDADVVKGGISSSPIHKGETTATPQTSTDHMQDKLPGQRQCPFSCCNEILDTDKASPDYYKVEAHLNSHLEKEYAKERNRLQDTIAKLESGLDSQNRINDCSLDIARDLGADVTTQSNALALNVDMGTQTKAPAFGIDVATQSKASVPRTDMGTQVKLPAPGFDKGTQTAVSEVARQAGTAPESEQRTVPNASSRASAGKTLLYCSKCLTSVNSLNEHRKEKHAEKCNIATAAFVLLTTQEAQVERKRQVTASVVPLPPVTKKRKAANDDGDARETRNTGDVSPRKKHKTTSEKESDDTGQPQTTRVLRRSRFPSSRRQNFLTEELKKTKRNVGRKITVLTEEDTGEPRETDTNGEVRRTRERALPPPSEMASNSPAKNGRKRKVEPESAAAGSKKARTKR